MEKYTYKVGNRTHTVNLVPDATPESDGNFVFFASDLGIGPSDFATPLLMNGMVFYRAASDVNDGDLRSVTYVTPVTGQSVKVFND